MLRVCSQARAGNYYGKGVYFAERAGYCWPKAFSPSSSSSKQLILSEVLTGKVMNYEHVDEATRALAAPPSPEYDSVCGGPHRLSGSICDSKVYVVYSWYQAYPKYIVTFSH